MAAEYWQETGLTMKYKMREDGTAGVPSSLLKIASGFETQRYVVIPEVSSERLKSNYGFEIKTTTKTSCAAKLMKMYQEMAQERGEN